MSEGNNTIYAKAKDNDGEWSQERSVSVTYNKPNVKPIITISSPGNGQTFATSNITVSGNASDSDGSVSQVQVKINNGSWQTASGTTNWSKQVTLSEGSNTIYAKAKDNDGEWSEEKSVTVTYSSGPANWTWMLYLYEDSTNLDGADDFNEWEANGSIPGQINYLVLYDSDNDSKDGIYYVEKDPNGYNSTIISPIVSTTLGTDPNMNNWETLRDFIIWVQDNYPAQHYGLTVWDHGSGIFRRSIFGSSADEKGCVGDMKLWEMDNALSEFTTAIGKKIDVVGFDVCLLGQVETVYQLKNYADYVIASEFMEPGDGWDYETSFAKLNANPLMDAATISTHIVNDYIDFYDYSDEVTQAATSTASLENDLIPALNNFADKLYGYMFQYETEITTARDNAWLPEYDWGEPVNPNHMDLGKFANGINNNSSLPADLRNSAQTLLDKLSIAVIAEGHKGNNTDGATGLKIWMTEAISNAGIEETYYTDITNYLKISETKWDEFLYMYEDPYDPQPTKIIRLTGNLDFGNVEVNTTATRTLTIWNDGNATLNVDSISYPNGFSGNWNGGDINSGGNKEITITFSPTSETNYSGMVNVSSDKTSGTNTISISGTGASEPSPILSVTPDFQSVPATIGTTEFNVTNSGTGTMNWTATENENYTWLEIVSGSPGVDDGTISISYEANDTGAERIGIITITANGATNSPKTVEVRQAAVGPPEDTILSITPPFQQFKKQTSFTTQIEIADVTNLGAFGFEVHFDPSLVCAQSVELSDFLSSTGRSVLPVQNNINCTTGVINYAIATFGTNDGPNGSDVLLTINWLSLNNYGSSDIQLENVQLTDINGNDILHTIQNATVDIAPVLSVIPSSEIVNTQSSFTTEIDITEIENLGAFEFEVKFDPSLVCAQSLELSDFLTSTGRTTIPVINEIDCETGLMRYSIATLGSNPGPDGDGTLVTINWNSLNIEGTEDIETEISLQNAQLIQADEDATSILPAIQNATITLKPCYQYDVDCDGDVDIGDIMKVAAKYGCNSGEDCYDSNYDIDNDGDTDIGDIMKVAAKYGWEASQARNASVSFQKVDQSEMIKLSNATRKNPRLVEEGETFTTDIMIYDVEDLGGFELDLNFEPLILTCTNAELINDFITGTGRTAIVSNSDINPNSVHFDIATMDFTGSAGPVSGNGILARTTWRVETAEPYNYSLTNVKVFDSNGDEITQNNYTLLVMSSIYKESGITVSEANSAGLSVTDIDFLQDIGDSLKFGYTNATDEETSENLTGTGLDSRMIVNWYFDKTDVSSNGGNVKIVFDFKGGTLPWEESDYFLIYRAGTSGNYTKTVNQASILDDKVIFDNVDVTQLANGYYTLGCTHAPSVITLISFTATACQNKIVLEWKTATEIETAGFHILRSDSIGGEYTRITKQIILNTGFAVSGDCYFYIDNNVLPGKTYYYQLEDIDTDTTSHFSDPAASEEWRPELEDIIFMIKILSGFSDSEHNISKCADINTNNTIDLGDVIYMLQHISEIEQ
ncbi:hypothetical protein GMMP15_570001 [Candidatus Magnetomoraceae bacterium gMMP-15]